MFNLPNQVTLARILLIPVFMVALFSQVKFGEWIAAIVFIIAAIMDGVDGYLARIQKRVTRFGKFFDPLADKLLISAALISLVDLGEISAWVAMLIIGREFAVTAIRLVALDRGKIVPAGKLGKAKTVMQIIAIIAFLLPVPLVLANTLLTLALILTLYSGYDYYVNLREHLIEA